MASGYRSGGVDFDDLFDLYVQGPKSQDTGRRIAGVDLSQRYANISYGTKRADVGYRVGGVDVSNFWPAKGTATYEQAGVPSNLYDSQFGAPGQPTTASVGATWTRGGDTSYYYPSGAGEWKPGAGATDGDAYDIMFTQTAGSGGTFTGTLNAWMQLNLSRGFSLSVTRSNLGAITVERTIRVDIRRRSDSVIVVSHSIDLSVTAESGG